MAEKSYQSCCEARREAATKNGRFMLASRKKNLRKLEKKKYYKKLLLFNVRYGDKSHTLPR